MIQRAVLKRNAKEQLKGKWTLAIITLLIGEIICNGFSFIVSIYNENDCALSSIGWVINLLLAGVIAFGICKFTLKIANLQNAVFEDLFSGFKIYLKTLGLYILMAICISIGLIFLIVPGVIIALMFSQAFFILCEDNNKTITECLKESKEMMIGHKGELFLLALSFLGWWILSAITFGIVGLWVLPYQQVTLANYYLQLKTNKLIA